MKSRLFILIQSIILFAFSCKPKIINEIPEHCYAEIYAAMKINGIVEDIIDEVNPVTKINDNYLFGASVLGDWDFTLESEKYIAAFNSHTRLISENEYETFTFEEWKSALLSRGQYSIKDGQFVTRTYLYDKAAERHLVQSPDDSHLIAGEVEIKLEQIGDCHFINVLVTATVFSENNGDTLFLELEQADVYSPLLVND